MQATTTTETIEVRITARASNEFRRALKAIKSTPGARYQPTTKTWLVPAERERKGWLRNVRGLYQVVAPSGRCPQYTTDQGCPLHGETCRS